MGDVRHGNELAAAHPRPIQRDDVCPAPPAGVIEELGVQRAAQTAVTPDQRPAVNYSEATDTNAVSTNNDRRVYSRGICKPNPL
jgi:hypothetical protein